MLVDDYLIYTKDYKKLYGDNTIVLMQVGSFFELYSIVDDIDSDIYKIADICNITISKKNKSIKDVDIHNPLMAGFPLYVINKFQNILLQNNYTIIMIEQVSEPPNPERKVTEILSPGMNININSKKSNNLMVIYYEKINQLYVVGVSIIDISIGSNFVYEIGSNKDDKDLANNEVFRLILAYNPSELVILSNDSLEDYDKNFIINYLNISNNILLHKKWNSFEYSDIMNKITYQKEILKKVYKSAKTQLNIIDYLNLEFYNIGRIAFCCLLQFAYNHNADIINDLFKPTILENDKILKLEYDSALQLNLISLNNNDKSLIDLLNRCNTSFGSRLFKQRLLEPIIDINTLNKRYDDIDLLLNNQVFKKISNFLNKVLDLERIKRKIIITKFNPHEWLGFNNSLENIYEIFKLLSYNNNLKEIETIINSYDIIDLDKASRYNINDIKGNIFKKDVYNDIDELEKLYNLTNNKIQNICKTVCDIDKNNDSTFCKIEYSERDGYYLLITKKRYDNSKSKNSLLMKSFNIITPSQQNNYKLSSNELKEYTNKIEETTKSISELCTKYYKKFLNNFINLNEKNLDNITNIVANIDISCCCAKNAYEYRYYRPKINKDFNKGGFINAKDIRHPIIERINQNVIYIGNDIELSNKGFLLYGVNASGKSSFMKTLGLNIIMAQSGMFVASDDFNYFPYNNIFTRISGVDNIYKGLSSFTVEMTELRNILQRSDNYSLVLGDEICNGTESTSGISIVASAIDHLINNKCSFIFATHLHELINIDIIKHFIEKSFLNIYHMHVSIENNVIYYDRLLKKGQGSTIYGIEVCKALDMPIEFMKKAEKIRKEIQGLDDFIISLNKSNYNKKIILDKCELCGEEVKDTHHINYQMDCDNNGYFKNYHKNIKHNLVGLCKKCHNNEHNNTISIKGYIETSEGVKLKVDYNPDLNPDSISDKSSVSNNSETEIISDSDIIKLKRYIIYNNKSKWLIRETKTSKFKETDSSTKIVKKINSLLKKNFTDIPSSLYNDLFDNTI